MARPPVSPEGRQQKLDEVQTLLKKLAAIDPDSLARTPDLSPRINFESAVPYLAEFLDVIRQLNDRDISRLPTDQLSKIQQGVTHLDNFINKINAFDINVNTPADACNGIINEIKNAYDSVMTPLIVPLAFTATQATDYAKIEREAKGCHTTMQQEAEKFSKQLEANRQEAAAALTAIKSQAADAGVSNNAHIFSTNADTHGVASKTWLKVTVWVAGITFLAALSAVVVAFYWHPASTQDVVQYLVAKLILLSTLSFAIIWCSRNYKAHKHNETLNRHRANALMTFRAFVEGTNSEAVKDAILLQAAQAAFSPRPTAYDSQEVDHQPIGPVVEVFGRAISKAASN